MSLFVNPQKSGKKAIPKTNLNTILAAVPLLADSKRQDCIDSIQANIHFVDTKTNLCVRPLFDRVALACQLLPSNQHPFYTSSGGLLDYALFRAKAAMSLYKQIVIPQGILELSNIQMRTAYVLLSASMLRGIGALWTDYEIEIFGDKKNFIGKFQALFEQFSDAGKFYQYQSIYTHEDALRRHITPLIAKNLIPQAGLEWICEDAEALLTWLQLLQEEKEGLNILEAILEHAEIIAWQEMAQLSLQQQPNPLLYPEQRRTGFIESPQIDQQQLYLIGLQFILWLRENLARGQMLINQTPIVALENGLNISPEAFKWFLQHHRQFKNWRLIQQGLMSLGLHDKTALADQGLVIHKFGYLLPPEVLVKNMNDQHHFKTKTIILQQQWKQYTQGKKLNPEAFQLRLNADGKWEPQANPPNAPGMQNV